eukprot:TRINITY_DN93_c0_g1_i1.p1 TRINITY_DN93_c0_g1~~TRINITY_DN93_c0_g1_i1.p1  ORF type:complete len:206 (+),score=45.54 TRINITY_DN93_c0_g1_i1:101-718(+)
MSNEKNYKIVLLGEGCVGKTSTVLRYVQNKFNENHITTIQATFLTKRLTLGNDRVKLAIWDTAGQERFHALGPIYYRGANGALLVYDITDKNSFERVKAWVKELRKMEEDAVITIVGNKIDMERNRTVPLTEAEQFAKSVGAVHMGASAKLNQGLDELFLDLTRRILQKFPDGNKKNSGLLQPSNGPGIEYVQENTNKGGCGCGN